MGIKWPNQTTKEPKYREIGPDPRPNKGGRISAHEGLRPGVERSPCELKLILSHVDEIHAWIIIQIS